MADETEAKEALLAELEAAGVKVDKRWGMAKLLAAKQAAEAMDGDAPKPEQETGPEPKPEPVVEAKAEPEPEKTDETIKAQLAELEALRAEKAEREAAEAAAPPKSEYNAPGGMTTAAHLGIGTPPESAEDNERRLLMEQINRLGIADSMPKRGNNGSLAAHITQHMAGKAAMQAVIDEQNRRAAKAPQKPKVAIRVLPLGDNKIATGVHIPGMGNACYARGDIIENVDLDIAQAHENAGRAEIVA